MGPTVAIHQPECFPWLGFVDKALRCDVFVLLDDVQYEKNYFHNRNKVRTSQGWTWVTIPTNARLGQRLDEVEIAANAPRWREKHLATWTQSYAGAPHAPARLDFLRGLYAKPWRLLVDFNIEVIRETFAAFGVTARVVRSSELRCEGVSSLKVLNICRALGAETYLSGVSGRDYLDEPSFAAAGIRVDYQEFRHPLYRQRHEPFEPCMSSWDLLFNFGPQSRDILLGAGTPRLDKVFL
jgi:hypothetical protein